MIAKSCSITIRIEKLQALDRRIAPNHPVRRDVSTELSNRMAGYRGEKSLEFHLSMLSDSKYYIFHGLRLKYKKYFFQVDNLLLCSSFGINLEVKNMGGELHFEKNFNQMVQTKKDSSARKTNPVLQAKLQAIKLKKWLNERNCPDIPIYYLFVNSNSKTLIVSEPGNERINQHICNSEFLIEKIFQIENTNKVEVLSIKELRKIKRILLASHTPDNPEILQHFNLTQNNILPGVQCPKCHYLPMKYSRGTWFCPTCKEKSKTAHIQAVYDYFLLIKPFITNSEFRQFLHIESIHIAQKLLASMKLHFTGKFKDRVYHAPPFMER
ncbi:nuclease-related domain-containing protein [Neobacillus sp. YX16]|uniref:nuclease-related domain-containing protein n=1 Tax=Neobacillus sp. YX16 TaxID=3047874 RepID=UPI0024C408D8|nr:nuclease-related domain-containing protein [Neobacillus sp. YX16]WHZ01957.1 nuclease-related domain-containing protein [Neobacillus sp. YX16]